MGGIGFLKKGFDTEDGMIQVIELRPCNVDVEPSEMFLDSLADAF